MNYKTLILDFDGTIADTRESIVQSMKFVADRLHIKDIDDTCIKSLIGLPIKTTFEKIFQLDEKLIQDAIFFYRNHYNNTAIDTISLFENVKDALLDFHHKGVNLTIASSKGKKALIEILIKQNIDDLFSFVGGEEDVRNKKPAPDMVNLIIDRYHCLPNECLVVGDTVFDIEMGKRAHADTCGVTYGNNTREQLENKRPNYIIDHFKCLSDILWK